MKITAASLIGWLFLLLGIGFPGKMQAQQAKIDSLRQRLRHQPADTARVLLLNQLGMLNYQTKPDTTYRLGQEAYQLAIQLGYPRGQARGLTIMAAGLTTMGDYPKAIRLMRRSIRIDERIHDRQAIARNLNNLSNAYSDQKENKLALQTLRLALKTYLASLPPHADSRTVFCAIIFLNFGELHLLSNELDSANYYLQQSYALTEVNHFKNIQGNILYDMGDVAIRHHQPARALHYYQRAIAVCRATNSLVPAAETYLRLARFYQPQGPLDSCLMAAQRALSSSQKSLYLAGTLAASQLLAGLYEGKDDRQALRYYKVAAAAKDSLFSQQKTKQLLMLSFEEQQRQQELVTARADFRNRMGLYGLLAVVGLVLTVAVLLWRTTRRQQRSNQLLSQQKQALDYQSTTAEHALRDLQATQMQLVQKEKMASLGELTAGIAHEMQNPLNFVNNFAEVSAELVGDLTQELDRGDSQEARAIARELTQNLRKINQHGHRAAAIVTGMLAHSRADTGPKQVTDLNRLANEYLQLAYQGVRAKDKMFSAELITDFDPAVGLVPVIPQELGRVLLNLYNNAFYAVGKRQQQAAEEVRYQPQVSVRTHRTAGQLQIQVWDNGTGIPLEVQQKIFQPFFTTKPAGEGTGLGLSLSYDSVTKSHGGTLTVESQAGQGTTFVVTLPL